MRTVNDTRIHTPVVAFSSFKILSPGVVSGGGRAILCSPGDKSAARRRKRECDKNRGDDCTYEPPTRLFRV